MPVISYTEAFVLGLGSGPVCLASCGPVLLPWMAAEGRDWRGNAVLLARFLTGRLAGYLAFAVTAWAAGVALPAGAQPRALVFGLANLALAVLLAWAALRSRPGCSAAEPAENGLVQITPPSRRWLRLSAAVPLGFVTGLNLCPPFVAAGLRAAQLASLPGALFFFALFFLGTAVWFAPSLAIAPLRRHPAVPLAARIVMGVLAVYYLYLGILSCATYRSLPVAAAFSFSSSAPWRYFHV